MELKSNIDNKYYLRRITEFLEEYMNFREDGYCENHILKKDFIIYGIQLLLDNDVFTQEELKRQALRKYHILIPDYYFKEGDCNGN